MKENNNEGLSKDAMVELSQNNNDWFVTMMIILMVLFPKNSEKNLSREELVTKINESDLSNQEKKQIMEIILK